jgi:hypothetical protein
VEALGATAVFLSFFGVSWDVKNGGMGIRKGRLGVGKTPKWFGKLGGVRERHSESLVRFG